MPTSVAWPRSIHASSRDSIDSANWTPCLSVEAARRVPTDFNRMHRSPGISLAFQNCEATHTEYAIGLLQRGKLCRRDTHAHQAVRSIRKQCSKIRIPVHRLLGVGLSRDVCQVPSHALNQSQLLPRKLTQITKLLIRRRQSRAGRGPLRPPLSMIDGDCVLPQTRQSRSWITQVRQCLTKPGRCNAVATDDAAVPLWICSSAHDRKTLKNTSQYDTFMGAYDVVMSGTSNAGTFSPPRSFSCHNDRGQTEPRLRQ